MKRIFAICSIFVLMSCNAIYASEIYYLNEGKFVSEEVPVGIDTFDYFFDVAPNCPENVEVNSVKLIEDLLFVDVSSEIMNYGGNEYEKNFIMNFVKTASSYENADYVTLLIEGEIQPLPEGRYIVNVPLNSI